MSRRFQRKSRPQPGGAGAAEIGSAVVAGGGTIVSRVPRQGRPELPWASTSVYAPVGDRSKLQAAATCPDCLGVTVARVDGPDVDGLVRRGACGHKYRLRIRRVYSPRPVAGDAA